MVLIFLAFLGCNKQEKQQIEEQVVVEEATPVLTLQVESMSASAGQDVLYTVTFSDQDNEAIDVSSWALESTVEANLFWNGEKFRPTVAGVHNISIALDHEGTEYTSSVELTVQPANAVTIDLEIDSYSVTAGEITNFSTFAEDQYGNVIDDLVIDVQSSSADLAIIGTQLSSTVADYYTLTASVNDLDNDGIADIEEPLTDVEYIDIRPSTGVDISLSVPTGDIELHHSIHCDVVVVDQYGNTADEPWTLTTQGGSTSIYYDSISFLEEGEYSIIATVDGTALIDTYGPFIVDSSGPALSISFPPRGSRTSLSTVEVLGNVVEEHSSLTSTTVNGTPLTLDANGDFSFTFGNNFGLNLIETIAEDSDGNISSDKRAVLSGGYWPRNSGMDDAINVYIGSAGIQTIEDYALDTLNSIDFMDYVPSSFGPEYFSVEDPFWCFI
jgi:hypothetical protein